MSALFIRLFAAPRWAVTAALVLSMLGTHAAAYRLGGAHQFREGFAAGETAMRDSHVAQAGERATRQIKDRLHAETRPTVADDVTDRSVQCGPSIRDCPR